MEFLRNKGYEQEMRVIAIMNVTRPLRSPLWADYCTSFFCRLRGLTFRRSIPSNQGLLLVQPRDSRINSSIHMLGVWMDLAVIWINSENIVVDKKIARSWRPAYIPRLPARYILELSPEWLNQFQIGDQIEIEMNVVV